MTKLFSKIISKSYIITVLIAGYLILSTLTPFWSMFSNSENDLFSDTIKFIDWTLWAALFLIMISNFLLFMIKIDRIVNKRVDIKLIKDKKYILTIVNYLVSLFSLVIIKAFSIIIQKFIGSKEYALTTNQQVLIGVSIGLSFFTFLILIYVMYMYTRNDVYGTSKVGDIDWNLWIMYHASREEENLEEKKDIEKQNSESFEVKISTILANNKKIIESKFKPRLKQKLITDQKMSSQSYTAF